MRLVISAMARSSVDSSTDANFWLDATCRRGVGGSVSERDYFSLITFQFVPPSEQNVAAPRTRSSRYGPPPSMVSLPFGLTVTGLIAADPATSLTITTTPRRLNAAGSATLNGPVVESTWIIWFGSTGPTGVLVNTNEGAHRAIVRLNGESDPATAG